MHPRDTTLGIAMTRLYRFSFQLASIFRYTTDVISPRVWMSSFASPVIAPTRLLLMFVLSKDIALYCFEDIGDSRNWNMTTNRQNRKPFSCLTSLEIVKLNNRRNINSPEGSYSAAHFFMYPSHLCTYKALVFFLMILTSIVPVWTYEQL